MTTQQTPKPAALSGGSTEQLCELVLEVAGKSTTRMATARRHVSVLERAYPSMSSAQRAIARERIKAIETKWGPMLYDEAENVETDGISPEERVGRWLSTRRQPERLLYILHRAASSIWEGQPSMSRVMDHSYARETDFVICPVGQTSFTEWMIELRIAMRVAKGVYAPGGLCEWWVTRMGPRDRKGTSYGACLEHAADVRFKTARGAG